MYKKNFTSFSASIFFKLKPTLHVKLLPVVVIKRISSLCRIWQDKLKLKFIDTTKLFDSMNKLHVKHLLSVKPKKKNEVHNKWTVGNQYLKMFKQTKELRIWSD